MVSFWSQNLSFEMCTVFMILKTGLRRKLIPDVHFKTLFLQLVLMLVLNAFHSSEPDS